ncbi:MAG TPA: c-type cytochrome domain-containing protein [Planctomycetaceae bacterium]|nr:c-type cytochrome domain-containing protein [Planctomycetaceae bacterium]
MKNTKNPACIMLNSSFLGVAILCAAGLASAGEPAAPSYADHVAPLFRKYCNGCHNADDANGELVLDDFAKLMKGGEHGPGIVPGQPDKSRLILVLEKQAEPFMPPEDNEAPTKDEIALLKAWIKAGARGPDGDAPLPMKLDVPKVEPTADVRRAVHAVAWSPDGKSIAVARYAAVEILAAGAPTDAQKPVRTLDGHSGHVNDVGFSRDGKTLFAAAGEPGLFGEATVWKTADWQRATTIRGHRDSLYSADLSPDGTILATGSYDQEIKLWDAATGQELRTLEGHNGAVFDLAFHPTGKILASASGDRTVKLWDVATGERLDTLGQPEKDQYAVAFSPDGRYVVGGGVDNRIRVWDVRGMGREGTNPLLFARFAHEQPILKLAYSPDGRVLVSAGEDRAIKLWETRGFTQRGALPAQPDWPSALAVAPDGKALIVGRLDGSASTFPLTDDLAAISLPDPIRRAPLPAPRADAPAQDLPAIAETEPNDTPERATPLPVPGTATGVLWHAPPQEEAASAADGQARENTTGDGAPATDQGQQTTDPAQADVDLYRFDARAGDTWIIETRAARDKSPADTKIEVLDAAGKPVERLLLRAVRDSYIEFRPIGSTENQARLKNWEEMDLNQFLYMNGEVVKLFRAPQGPDSGFLFYTISGQRRCYFDTSATIHPLDQTVYIVEPYPPGTELIDNGLPVFPLYYANDDDADRKLGSDSQLAFTAPADGSYLVRVTDVRGFGGPDYKYALTIRPPKPDFNASVNPRDLTVGAGSGQRFAVMLDRIDGFDEDVRIDVENVPAGYSIPTPIVVAAGHLEAQGVVIAAPDAGPVPRERWSEVKMTASATAAGQPVTKPVTGFNEIKKADKPKVIVTLAPESGPAAVPVGRSSTPSAATAAPTAPGAERSVASNESPDGLEVRPAGHGELVIAPGTSITAMLSIERNGFDGELTFDVENLPHGMIVDDIGLSGVLIRRGETHRRIFLKCADWVPETTRRIHAVAKGEGNQASRPIVLHVVRPVAAPTAGGTPTPGTPSGAGM